jgi:hypothetical protein
MARFGRDRGRLRTDHTQTLTHPVRIGILSLFARNPGRSLAAADLLAALTAEDPDAYGGFDAGQIAYHRARLQDADLLPTG